MPVLDDLSLIVSRAREALRSSLYTNAMYLILAQATMAGLGFFFWVIVARYYTEAELGYSSAIISTIGLVALIGHMGLDSFLVRFLAGAENPRRLFNTCLTYAGLATGVAAVIAAVGMPLWSPRLAFVSTQPVFFAAFVCFAVVSTLSGICSSGFIAGRQAKYLLLKDALFSGTKLFLPLLFVQHFHAFGVVASSGLAATIGLLASLLIFMPRVLPGYAPVPTLGAKLVRRAWGFSGMSYVISLIAASPKFMMPLIVINVLGPEENAYFYVAWAIATLLFAIPTSMGQSLFAEGSHDKRKLHRDIRRATMLSGLLLVPAVLFVWLLGEVALLAFGGSYSERSIELLRILALAALPMTFERIYFTVLRIRGRLRELTIWRTVLSVVLLSACALLIPAGGLKVIGWVWLATHGAAAAAILMFRSALWTGR
jgi:O-antigen/teichoic acid export membrane protein